MHRNWHFSGYLWKEGCMMEKILGLLREELEPEELRFLCAFWTELGYEIVCPPPGSPKHPSVPLWCGTKAGTEEIKLHLSHCRIAGRDIWRLRQLTGESVRNIHRAQRRSFHPKKKLAQICKYWYNKRKNRGYQDGILGRRS